MTRYREQLLKMLNAWVSKASWLFRVDSDELITRYIYESNKFSPSANVVKPRAFLPDSRGETSVFRIKGLFAPIIWAIGDKVREKPAVARADMLASKIFETMLRVRPAPLDHLRHAVIVGWPGIKDKEKEKHERMMLATLLASAARLELH